MRLAFESLNLRWNPFGELDREAWADVAVVDLEPPRPGEVLQLLGEAGRGKTTHLLALRARADRAARGSGSVYEYVPEGSDRIRSELSLGRPFYLDEAQRVRRRDLARFFARGAVVAFASHEDVSRHSEKPVRTVVLRGLDRARLERIVAARIEAARRGPGPVPAVEAAHLDELLARHGDDLRAIVGALYDRFQHLEGRTRG